MRLSQECSAALWVLGSLSLVLLLSTAGRINLPAVHFGISDLESIAAAIESVVTVLGIAAALWWFNKRREKSPRANIDHEVKFSRLDANTVYVGVSVCISNVGNVAVIPKIAEPIASVVAIEELAPYLASKQESQEFSPQYKLGLLGLRTFPRGIRIEPGEHQTILFEFVIPAQTRIIKVYSHIDNDIENGIGWDHTTIHEAIYE